MTDDTILIRQANLDDHETLVKFNQTIALVTENRNLPYDIVWKGVEKVLSDATKGFYLVALIGEEVAGSLMVTYEWSDWQAKDFWWIQSVFVKDEYRRKGVYSKLYEEVKVLASINNAANEIRLYVEHDNEQAKAAYSRLGMTPSHYLIYEENISNTDK